jgi:predicted tellurium resistance membrane protein TerC
MTVPIWGWAGTLILLVFIGVKMLISPVIYLPVTVSLAVIMVVVGGAVALSLLREKRRQPAAVRR